MKKKTDNQVSIERLETIHSALSNWKVALTYMLNGMQKSIDEYKRVVAEIDFEKLDEGDLR